MQIVNQELQFPKVTLVPPNQSGYIIIAAETGSSMGLFPTQRAKTEQVITKSKAFLTKLKDAPSVRNIHMFQATLFPPGRGNLAADRKVHDAKFDLVILIETESIDSAIALRDHTLYTKIVELIESQSKATRIITAKNIRKISDVNHIKQGVFLFNFFYADDVSELLPVWEYTAGWFAGVTKLNNSTLFQPVEGEKSEYGLINHCRWNTMSEILPHLLFKSSFKKFVLKNFEANNIAAMPVFYKMV